jgi:hypothetical protein
VSVSVCVSVIVYVCELVCCVCSWFYVPASVAILAQAACLRLCSESPTSGDMGPHPRGKGRKSSSDEDEKGKRAAFVGMFNMTGAASSSTPTRPCEAASADQDAADYEEKRARELNLSMVSEANSSDGAATGFLVQPHEDDGPVIEARPSEVSTDVSATVAPRDDGGPVVDVETGEVGVPATSVLVEQHADGERMIDAKPTEVITDEVLGDVQATASQGTCQAQLNMEA